MKTSTAVLPQATVIPRIAECYQRYSRELWLQFYGMCSDPERAWEAVQEAFLRYQSHDVSAVRDERAWLTQVGRNWLRDVARRKRVAQAADETLEEVRSDVLDPAGSVEQSELRGQVGQALQAIRSDDREVLLLHYALGWTAPRIAEVLGIRVAAVEMRLTRARQRLAVALDDLGVNASSLV